MKKSEVAELLTAIASTDNRTVGRLDVEMWFKILPEDLTLANAQDALIRLRLETNDWLTPKHIVDRVTEVRRDRLQRAGTPPIPGDLTWHQEKAWRVLWCDNVKDGMGVDDAAAAASHAMGIQPLAIEATPESVAAERKALVQKLADSKSTPRARPEDAKPKKPRTRWGCWARGNPEIHDAKDVIVFGPYGQVLYHDGGPYGIEINKLGNDLEYWLYRTAGKGWGDSATLTALARAWCDITDADDDKRAWAIVKVSEAIDAKAEEESFNQDDDAIVAMNQAHPAGGAV